MNVKRYELQLFFYDKNKEIIKNLVKLPKMNTWNNTLELHFEKKIEVLSLNNVKSYLIKKLNVARNNQRY